MANSSIRITELDFHSIKANLKDFLRDQAEFTDYDFEGSGMSVLLDILAYNTHYMGYYLNMAANEMFLDTAQLRNSMLSHAKMINYVPGSSRGAMVRANVVITPSVTEDQNTTILTMDKYTKFLAQDKDGVNYQFVALHSNTALKVDSRFSFANVYLKQGEVVTRQYLVAQDNRFTIPSSNIDTDTLVITVQQSTSNTYTEEYQLSDDMTEMDANSKSFFIEEAPDGEWVFYFGDNIIGKKPTAGNIVIATYLDTVGSKANNISNFYPTEDIGSEFRDNVVVSVANSSFGGVDRETVEQMRFRAPYFYTAQNRAVTTNDYESLILHDYNNIEAVSVWGGEDNDPVVYGKVYLSLKTRGNYALTTIEKEEIKNELIRARNVMTVIPEIVDPDYNYILISGKVYYDPALTSLSSGEILTYVRAAIADYNEQELNKFSSTFRKSKLQAYIEAAEKSITGSDIDVFIQKRFDIELEEEKNYKIKFNMPIKKGDFIKKLYTYPTVSVYDLSSVSREVFFEEVPSSFTGIDSISVVNPGHDYDSVPTVTITGDGHSAEATAVIVNGKVNRIDVDSKGIDYSQATISITGGNGSEATAAAVLEARMGTLRSFYFKTNGEKVLVDETAGTINYDTGLITIDGLYALSVTENDNYEDDELTMAAPCANQVIVPLRNRLLTIDENNGSSIQIEMVAE